MGSSHSKQMCESTSADDLDEMRRELRVVREYTTSMVVHGFDINRAMNKVQTLKEGVSANRESANDLVEMRRELRVVREFTASMGVHAFEINRLMNAAQILKEYVNSSIKG